MLSGMSDLSGPAERFLRMTRRRLGLAGAGAVASSVAGASDDMLAGKNVWRNGRCDRMEDATDADGAFQFSTAKK